MHTLEKGVLFAFSTYSQTAGFAVCLEFFMQGYSLELNIYLINIATVILIKI